MLQALPQLSYAGTKHLTRGGPLHMAMEWHAIGAHLQECARRDDGPTSDDDLSGLICRIPCPGLTNKLDK